jgi:hypothetical protein
MARLKGWRKIILLQSEIHIPGLVATMTESKPCMKSKRTFHHALGDPFTKLSGMPLWEINVKTGRQAAGLVQAKNIIPQPLQ